MNGKGEIIIYETKDGKTSIDVKMEGETIWLTLNQISTLFKKDKSVISRHIRNIFLEGELEQNSTVAKNARVQKEEVIKFFQLSQILRQLLLIVKHFTLISIIIFNIQSYQQK